MGNSFSIDFRLVKSETLTLTREHAMRLAGEHMLLPRSPTERDFDEKHKDFLLDRFKNGLLLPCGWAKVRYEGHDYRMNGQHSATALTEAGDSLPDRIFIHFDTYEAETASGMGLLFRQFDPRQGGRSKAHVAGSYQGLVPVLKNVSRKTGKFAIDGIAWYLRLVEKMPVPSGDDLYAEFFCEAYHSFILWLDKILTVKTPEMERPAIIGAMYETFLKSQSGAQEFWVHVAKSDLSDDTAPAAVLSTDLVAIKSNKGKEPVGPGELYAKCIKAWGAFRNGDKISSLKVNINKGLPPCAA